MHLRAVQSNDTACDLYDTQDPWPLIQKEAQQDMQKKQKGPYEQRKQYKQHKQSIAKEQRPEAIGPNLVSHPIPKNSFGVRHATHY
jgi:hypothetical protein